MENLCLICGRACDPSKESIVNKPTKKGLLGIIKAAESRQDEFSENILSYKNEILSGMKSFRFHTSCRSSYISRGNIAAKLMPSDLSALPSTSSNDHLQTRSTNSFEIRTMCLFCERTGKKKQEKLTSVQTGTYIYLFYGVFQRLTKKWQ